MEQFHLGFDIDTKPLANAKQAAQDAAASIGKLGDAEEKLAQQAAKAADSQKDLKDAIGGSGGGGNGGVTGGATAAGGAFERWHGILNSGMAFYASAAAAYGYLGGKVIDSARAVADLEDKYQLMEARLKNALGSQYAATSAMDALYKSTQQTGTGFQAATDSFLRMARQMDALGATRSEIQVLSETVQKLGLVSGASKGEIQSGMIQLSQALASGRLNGDELRSIMENMPALAKAIADGLGKSVGEMRAMGAAGELTGGKVFAAILKQSGAVEEEFKKLPNTAAREFQKVEDSWEKLLSDMAHDINASGLVQGFAGALNESIQKARQKWNAPMADNLAMVSPQFRFMQMLNAQIGAKVQGPKPFDASGEVALLRQMENDTRAEETIKMNKDVTAASPIAKELDDRANKISKLNEEIKGLEAGIASLNSRGVLAPDQQKTLEGFNRALIIAKQELKDADTPVQKLGKDFGNLQAAIAQGGGGGATALITQAQKLADDMKRIGVNGGGALGMLIGQEVAKGQDQINTMQMQVAATQRLTAATGEQRDVVRELEIENEAATKRYQMFGTLQSPLIDGFMAKYTEALRAQKKAAEEANAANTIYANTLEQKIAGAQMYVIGNDYQQRRSVAELRAREADRRTPGVYQSEMDKFDTNEDLSRARSVESLRRQMQSGMDKQAAGLGSLPTEEYRVQLAIFQKKAELEQQGIQADDDRYQSAVRLTETIERQNIAFEKQRKQIEAIEGVIDNMASSFRSSFVDTLAEAFKTGKFNASTFFESIGDMARKAGAEMTYEIAIKPVMQLLANAAKAGISQYFGSAPAMTSQTSSVTGGTGNAAGVSYQGWSGAAFDKGVKMFAKGGVVDSPTLFKFANGGSVGLMGEAGTEAIMPLKRGSDGRLGVSAHGGGGGDVQVIVQDMRGNAGSAPVQTETSTNSDGVRQIRIMVRDEIRRSMAAGEFDRTMQTNFGTSRQIARM